MSQKTRRKEALEGIKVNRKLEENIKRMNEALGVGKSFDVICRRWIYGGKEMALYFIEGFVKDEVLNILAINLAKMKPSDLEPDPLDQLFYTYIGYLELYREREISRCVKQVLSGPLVLFIDGEEEALVMDARTYPARGPEEPDIEKVVRGPRDGYTETIVHNTALTRRRVRDPSLRMEHMTVGRRSKTDLVIAYIEDLSDPDLVQEVKRRIQSIQIDGLPMAEKTLEEFLFQKNWNPFPMVRYTERPDVAAVHLLEGHVLIFVDTSPSVMITPTTLFHHLQHAEEYRQKPVVGAYLRWVRFLAILVSVFLLPIWFYFAMHPSLLPESLRFLDVNKKGDVPLFWQLFVAEIGVDILRMASIHVPSPMSSALGLVSAIILGQIGVSTGLFVPEVIFYVAVAVIGNFATPSYELSLANRLVRLTLLFATYLLGPFGLLGGILFWFFLLLFSKSITLPYLWPMIPFHRWAFKDIMLRSPVPVNRRRPSILSPDEPDRAGE
ncbi:spore germination protein [Thermicanus aegyptius]|uniref:spore germination protein n=1 Tax=Thermicanus aegyptius TaxID=94009 RepID=UPI000587FACB|nr:spore germination protein [Thermicanus aegyptius]